ncbi:MAG: tRNA (guanosine(37)-N1)-methyltransferase TrmD [Eubacteriales bacterium]|nr:tRNA (guanosine(37)-N1)-methyltransferase TrmD [Eubacteriales bacterium]
MNFYVMTLFPEMIMQGVSTSITGRAMAKGVIGVEAVNIRDYTNERHGHVDDAPYGGGAGMVMQAQPIMDCYRALTDKIGKKPRVIYLTPQGRVFSQSYAKELAAEEELVFLCGHYEGVDERALSLLQTENVSIGDYVLTGGELPAMVMIDCISRLVPGVLGKDESADIESFHDNLLEYPQYTRPEVYEGLKVPDILLSGHHANVEKWRREQSIERTLAVRPDLLPDAVLSKKERQYLERLLAEQKAAMAEKENISPMTEPDACQ